MIYFVSDLHFGFLNRADDIKVEEKFIGLLNLITNGDTLVIVGDLFDYWFDYRKVIPAPFFNVLSALFKLSKSGAKIIYLIGNHDFGHYRFFRDELNIKPIETDLSLEFYGKKFYLSHGDGKSYSDFGYKIIKKFLRNKFLQSLYRLIHPDLGIWLASGSSRKSRHYTETKDYGNRDGMKDFACKKIDEGYDYVIMGHRHKLCEFEYKNGKYINLGEWIKNPHYGIFDGKEFRMVKI